MQDTRHVEIPARIPDQINQFNNVYPPEVQADIIDSMSPPHTTEYISAQHALAQDRATLQLIDKDIEECRVRIAREHAQMRLFERQRGAVERRMSVHRARLSPVRVVPDQVLQEIFQRCLPDDPYVVPNARSAPLALTHVCRRWRVVARGTSELWSSIALHDRGVWNYELEVQMVKQWLDRSRMRPIRMSITCSPHTDFGLNRDASYSNIFQLAIAHSAHIGDLCLNVDRTYLRSFMDRAGLPALRSIVISLHPFRRIDEPLESIPPVTFTAPNLRRIAFKGDGSLIHLIPPTILPHITHLSIDCNVTLDLVLLFREFSGLQHLAFTLSHSRHSVRFRLPPQNGHRIIVPSLAHFDIHLDRDMLEFGDPETLETVLDQLELPALQTLCIAAPLRPRYREQTGRTEASWENHAAWIRSPSVTSLLSRSRHVRPWFECRDLVYPRRTKVWVREN